MPSATDAEWQSSEMLSVLHVCYLQLRVVLTVYYCNSVYMYIITTIALSLNK